MLAFFKNQENKAIKKLEDTLLAREGKGYLKSRA